MSLRWCQRLDQRHRHLWHSHALRNDPSAPRARPLRAKETPQTEPRWNSGCAGVQSGVHATGLPVADNPTGACAKPYDGVMGCYLWVLPGCLVYRIRRNSGGGAVKGSIVLQDKGNSMLVLLETTVRLIAHEVDALIPTPEMVGCSPFESNQFHV